VTSPLSRAEREHILRWSDDPTDPLTFFTHSEKAAKSLLKAGGRLRRVSEIKNVPISWQIDLPREWIRWPRAKRRREMSVDAKKVVAERLQNARQAQKVIKTVRRTSDDDVA
jgi:ribosomal protein L18E